MYKELDEFITEYQNTTDFWYDVGCEMASDKLLKFSPQDWEELSSNVLTKPLEWQKKLAYCMDNSCNVYELKILLSLINTEDEELFEVCIDTLRSFKTPEAKQMILDNPSVIYRVNKLLPNVGAITRKTLEEFLANLSSK